MRGMLDDLRSPSPLEQALPGMFQDDDFTCRFVSAFDIVVAPVFTTLDNLSAYLDPGTAPEDFLEWLAGWFGLELDATWTIERRRAAVRDIVDLYRWRGTAQGVRAQLTLQLGDDVDIEIDEGGGVSWSPTPGAALPGATTNQVVVRIRAADTSAVDLPRVEAMVRAVVPAHLATSVELSGGRPGAGGGGGGGTGSGGEGSAKEPDGGGEGSAKEPDGGQAAGKAAGGSTKGAKSAGGKAAGAKTQDGEAAGGKASGGKSSGRGKAAGGSSSADQANGAPKGVEGDAPADRTPDAAPGEGESGEDPGS